MELWKQLKGFRFWQLSKLFRLFAFKPHWVLPTYKATKKTLELSHLYFAETHRQNGFPNAFRHALWNILLCKNLHRKNQDETVSAQKADKITLLHESIFQNAKLDKIMDVHNNQVGQRLFIKHADMTVDAWVALLLKKEKSAVIFSTEKDLKNLSETLVYLA